MSNVFFVSIQPEINNVDSLSIDRVYGCLGLNTGNLLLTNAVWSQLEYENAESGFQFDPHYVNANFDHVVIPAANWLYEGVDLTDLAVLIEQLTIPVIFIGLGAQAALDNKIPVLPEGTLRLVKAASVT